MKLFIALLVVISLYGCALFDSSLKDNPINIGDGKLLGVDVLAPIKNVFDILPSCNDNHQLTANCIIGCIDGITGSQSIIDPTDKATQEAIKQLGLSETDNEEYLCCKSMCIAGTYLVNKYGGNLPGIAALLRLVK